MTQELDLNTIFKTVAGSLAANKDALNQSDTYNHNHGDHMVEIFKVAQRAVARKKTASAAEQLAYASQQVRKNSTSGSAAVYADGLASASKKFVGKKVNEQTVGTLIESMMGLDQPEVSSKERASGGLESLLSGLTSGQVETQQPQAGGDLLGSLLSGMTGSQQAAPPSQSSGGLLGSLLSGMTGGTQEPQQTQTGGDLLGSLLSGLGGTSQPQQQPSQPGGDLLSALLGGSTAPQTSQSGSDLLSTLLSGGQSSSSSSSNDLMGSLLSGLTGGSSQSDGNFDTTDLLSAGLAFFMAKQQGSSNLQAIMQALSKNSRFGNSAHRTESGALVVQSILNLLKK